MLQELFRIPIPGFGELPIFSYGLMLVIGFLAAVQLAKFLARRTGIDPEIFVNAGLIALVTGIVGARLSHILENTGQYFDPTRSAWANFKDAINIRSGGLTYYGGFLLAFPTLVWYALKKKLPLRLSMDIAAPCIMIGLAFGRIGCFLNGCCYGDQCSLPWAVQFPYHSWAYQDEFDRHKIEVPPELLAPTDDGRVKLRDPRSLRSDPGLEALAASEHSLPLHPAQIYSAITAFLIAGITLVYFTLPHAVGRGFALMLMLEGGTRFLLELLRVEPPVVGSFSLSMILGLALLAMGIAMWFALGRPSLAAAATPRPTPA
jgi:phosphatidylglycerol:prolipoprotein diacylglycerol transferase